MVLSALVFSSYALIQLHQLFFQSNGAGGPGWAIGQPQTQWNFRLGNQPLPELRALALELVNRDRQVNGLPPLVEDPLLAQVAQRHAEDMLKHQFYDHVNPDGQDPSDRFRALGGQAGAGENIMQQKGTIPVALSFGLVEEYQKGWMYSPGHRENLLTPHYTTFGYGIVANSLGTEIYAVQLFSFPP
ncbi:CAP domain-containing protein [Nodosilinea sp. E11]|uniref:CAP domain-containing protein n=1 Tax=Nodosilinea sp. E11 TaxID=3037479 RepID=UPI0029347BA8|nr:CAP domain-containing protein [Nodosilinea sp. E11]WOD37127.1 CAP domain-containing protein [Nodosilinea sp. E11]